MLFFPLAQHGIHPGQHGLIPGAILLHGIRLVVLAAQPPELDCPELPAVVAGILAVALGGLVAPATWRAALASARLLRQLAAGPLQHPIATALARELIRALVREGLRQLGWWLGWSMLGYLTLGWLVDWPLLHLPTLGLG
jgi:hypothetical protein